MTLAPHGNRVSGQAPAHLRGDGTAIEAEIRASKIWRPPSWGWHPMCFARVAALVPGPTCVGIVRRSATSWSRACAVAHPGGDRPNASIAAKTVVSRCPPSWGSPGEIGGVIGGDRPLPTRWGWHTAIGTLPIHRPPAPTCVGMARSPAGTPRTSCFDAHSCGDGTCGEDRRRIRGCDAHLRGDSTDQEPLARVLRNRCPPAWEWHENTPRPQSRQALPPTSVGMTPRTSTPWDASTTAAHPRGNYPSQLASAFRT